MTFAKHGAKLDLLDVNYEKLEAVKTEVEEYTKDVFIYNCDVSDEASSICGQNVQINGCRKKQ